MIVPPEDSAPSEENGPGSEAWRNVTINPFPDPKTLLAERLKEVALVASSAGLGAIAAQAACGGDHTAYIAGGFAMHGMFVSGVVMRKRKRDMFLFGLCFVIMSSGRAVHKLRFDEQSHSPAAVASQMEGFYGKNSLISKVSSVFLARGSHSADEVRRVARRIFPASAAPRADEEEHFSDAMHSRRVL